MESLPLAGPYCTATAGDRCITKDHAEHAGAAPVTADEEEVVFVRARWCCEAAITAFPNPCPWHPSVGDVLQALAESVRPRADGDTEETR
jgi:hypothetical protein